MSHAENRVYRGIYRAENSSSSSSSSSLREFACLITVILASLRVEAGLRGRSATSVLGGDFRDFRNFREFREFRARISMDLGPWALKHIGFPMGGVKIALPLGRDSENKRFWRAQGQG